jgi:two-component system, chemotaxis family, CheB/CheR fusion protein
MPKTARKQSYSQLIVIGSSAGGIEALSVLVSTLPHDFPAPIVLAQHLDPHRPSHLQEILARRSPLPVRTVTDRTALEGGVIFVVPANQNATITDSHIAFESELVSRTMPSIDQLFKSAADTFGDQLIAVILTGMGTDGAAGAYAVKRAGGTVIVQDPNTAAFPAMPLALSPATVDIVANLDHIGGILRDLLTGAAVPAHPDEQHALEQFLGGVRDRYGIDFRTYKTPTILRRLRRRIVATDTENLDGYTRYLQDHPEEYAQLLNAFLIKVTEFFRDGELFAYLRNELLPELVAQARKHGNELRIWSAGCATGEEAYSLAILVAEVLGTALEHFTVRIFATDLDEEAIAFARHGVYAPSALADLPPDLIARYFTPLDGGYEIRKRVRSLVAFGQHDLAQRAPFPRIDLVLCRNVLIYFTTELQQRTLQLFAYSLRDGGQLVLGKAETNAPLAEYFVPQHNVYKVYRRTGERILMPPAALKQPGPLLPRPSAVRRLPPPRPTVREGREGQQIRSFNESVLLRLPVGVVVVDRHYDIQFINGAARQFLSIYGAAIGEDLIHIAQGIPERELRALIDHVFRAGESTSLDEIAVEDPTTASPRYLQIVVHPQADEGEPGPLELVMLIVSNITPTVQWRQELDGRLRAAEDELAQAQRNAATAAARREEAIGRLVETNRQLTEANQSLTAANEDLRTTSEEFLLSTEEAQAATEEVETLNEEMQATNEELETLNEELQATIEELNTTNDDLQARSAELQELARTSDEERARLEALLTSMGDAVLVVDTAGRTLLTNRAYEQYFGGPNAPLLPEDETGHQLPRAETPQRRVARGESFRSEFTLTGDEGARRSFEANAQPVYDSAGQQQWGVIVIRDITERSLHRLQERFLALASHELRTPVTAMQGYLQLLERHLTLPEDSREQRFLASALTQVSRLTRLINDLVDVSRLENNKYTLDQQPLRAEEVVARSVELAQTLTAQQTIRLEEHDTPLWISADAGRLEQVMLNLLTNAVKYAPDSAFIDVRMRRADQEAEIVVQDYGPGIAEANLSNIFSRFFQVAHSNRQAHGGLGLGLFIAHEIMTAQGGTIAATSADGEGTTFTIRLPLLENPPAEEQQASPTREEQSEPGEFERWPP